MLGDAKDDNVSYAAVQKKMGKKRAALQDTESSSVQVRRRTRKSGQKSSVGELSNVTLCRICS